MRLEFLYVMKGHWHRPVSWDDALVALVLLPALIYTCRAPSLLPDVLPSSPGENGQTRMTNALQSYSLCFRVARDPFGAVHRVAFMLLMGVINLYKIWEM